MEIPDHLKGYNWRSEMFYPRFTRKGEFLGWDLKDDAYNEFSRIANLQICTEIKEIKDTPEGMFAVVGAYEIVQGKGMLARNSLAGVGSWEKPDHFIQFAETRARQRLIATLLGITGFDIDLIATGLEKEGTLNRTEAKARDDDQRSKRNAAPKNIIEPSIGGDVDVFKE